MLLSKVYNNIIKNITFKLNTELLDYTINTRSVQLVENNRDGVLNYSPVSSDDESDNDYAIKQNQDKPITVDSINSKGSLSNVISPINKIELKQEIQDDSHIINING